MENLLHIVLILFELIFIQTDRFLIEGIRNPQQIIWRNEYEVIIVQDMDILKLNILTKEKEKIGERQPNEFVGLNSKGELMYCEIQHFLIQERDEYSTIFKIYDQGRNLVKELKFFETIRPVYLHDNNIVAVTALDFLETHYYDILIENGEYKEREEWVETESEVLDIDTFGNIYITLDNTKTMIPTLIPILKTMLSNNPMKDPIPAFKLLLKSL